MNEILRRISDDLEKEETYLPKHVISELKTDAFIASDDEFEAKLVMVAGRYLVETEKLEEEKKQLRSEIYKLNKLYEELRRYYSIHYKEVLSKKAEKGIKPAKKVVSEQAVNDLKSLGNTDEQICEILGISRSTLWRNRKQWKEADQKKQMQVHNEKQSDVKLGDGLGNINMRFNW